MFYKKVVFYKKDALKNFAKIYRKTPAHKVSFLIKLEAFIKIRDSGTVGF